MSRNPKELRRQIQSRARGHAEQAGRDTERVLVAGPNAVEAVLDAVEGRSEGPRTIASVQRVYLEDTAGGRSQRLAQRAHGSGVAVSMMGKGECDRMAGARCQGVAAEVAYAYAELDDLLVRPGLIVFLDGVADPHNLGAILRTAEAAGATGAVIPERRAAQVNATVMRVSAGAAVFLPVARVTNLVRALQQAKDAGFWVVGLDAEGEALLPMAGRPEDPRAGDRYGLVVGGEGEGMHRLVREHCDEVARLPMRGRVESLNASVAAGLAIYRLLDGTLFGAGAGGRTPEEPSRRKNV